MRIERRRFVALLSGGAAALATGAVWRPGASANRTLKPTRSMPVRAEGKALRPGAPLELRGRAVLGALEIHGGCINHRGGGAVRIDALTKVS